MLLDNIDKAKRQQDPKHTKSAEKIAKAEAMKEMHAKLRFISHDGASNNGLTRLEVPNDPIQDP